MKYIKKTFEILYGRKMNNYEEYEAEIIYRESVLFLFFVGASVAIVYCFVKMFGL
jgi:hypothetical protein